MAGFFGRGDVDEDARRRRLGLPPMAPGPVANPAGTTTPTTALGAPTPPPRTDIYAEAKQAADRQRKRAKGPARTLATGKPITSKNPPAVFAPPTLLGGGY